jgi:peptide/nickel transport system substrate-binding protein
MRTLLKTRPARRRPALAGAAAVVTASLLLAGCTGGDESGGGPVADGAAAGQINARILSDPSGFNPALATGVQTFTIIRPLFDTLLRRDTEGIVGGLASDWTAESPTEYTFTIRDGATCSDGTEITPTVVADSLNYLADPEVNSPWRALVFGHADATITPDDAASTVHISLSEPFTDLEAGLTVPQTGIICPAGLADLDGLAAGTVDGAYSGPYALTDASSGISYGLTFNEGYDAWPDFAEPLEGHPAETIEFTISSDESTTANQVLSGQVDFADFADWNTIARFEGNDSIHQHRITAFTTYVVFNQRPGHIFADRPDLREAVAQAIDPEGFNAVFSNGNADVLTTIVPSSYECASTDESLLTPTDVDAAAEVLAGVDGIKLLGNTANRSFSNGADYLYSALTDAGAGVDLKMVDNTTWHSTTTTDPSQWDLIFIGDQNVGQTISASLNRNMGPAIESNGRNYSGSDNPEGVAAMERGLASVDPDERCAAFDEAQKTLFERHDVVPLVGGTTVTVTRDNVTARKNGEGVDPATLRITE